MIQRLRKTQDEHPPEYAYHVLRGALEKFGKGVAELSSKEQASVYRRADRSYELESRVVNSPEAQGVVIGDEQVNGAIQELVSRYPDRGAFVEDLTTNGVSEEALYRALYRELVFDAVMNKVAARSASISDLDVQLFYQMHLDRFRGREIRHVRHILVTVNSEYADNQRNQARQRIDELRAQVLQAPESFAEMALKGSECPSAMQDGVLGKVARGMLYPELDEVLFGMQEGEISDVVESELGFHVLLCEKIEPAKEVSLAEAKPRIRALLEDRQRRNCQKAWLTKLGESSQ